MLKGSELLHNFKKRKKTLIEGNFLLRKMTSPLPVAYAETRKFVTVAGALHAARTFEPRPDFARQTPVHRETRNLSCWHVELSQQTVIRRWA